MKRELKILAALALVFLLSFFMPWEAPRVRRAAFEAAMVLREYAREHVLFCLIPAFFIAGGISIFISQAAVMRYFGAQAKKVLAYGVASVSGSVLAVCSCTVLPLFAGIYSRGAGLGPATTFLYSGPAINVLAIILTARVLGWEIGLARAIGAVVFGVVIGLLMHLIFLKEERRKAEEASFADLPEEPRPLSKTAVYFALMIGVLVFANWGAPAHLTVHKKNGEAVTGVRVGKTSAAVAVKEDASGRTIKIPTEEVESVEYSPSFYTSIYHIRYWVALLCLLLLVAAVWRWFSAGEVKEWFGSTWFYAKLILPLLFAGVVVAGFLLGRPGEQALIPAEWISESVGGNGWLANAAASVAGALMYFATLTEVPILQGLLGAGMGKGPALALLLAGPALSLPNMLVIRQVMGTKKTLVYVALVCVMATTAGKIFGLVVR